MVVGNSHVISFFDRCMQKGVFSHAYLFVGPESVGKTHVAIQITKVLARTHPQSFLTSAAQEEYCPCDSCGAIDRGTHPDVITFSDSLAIENARTLKKQLSQSPLISSRRIIIVKNIQKATPEAAQALLKLLEEPSASTIFFLTAEYIASVPSTIVSRSTALHFLFVSQKEMQVLMPAGSKQKTLEKLAPYWRGRPGRLMRLLNDEMHAQRVSDEKKRAERFLYSSLAQRFSIAQQLGSLERQDSLVIFEEWMIWWKQAGAFRPLDALYRFHQSLMRTPLHIQTSLEYLAIATMNKRIS